MFVVYTPEGRNFIGSDPRRQIDPASKINPVTGPDFSDTMMDLDKTDPQRYAMHQRANHALNQYQKQLETMSDRHVVVTVGEIMTTQVLSLPPQATLTEVWQIMQQRKIQHLPVVENGQLVGICSSQELLRYVIVNQENKIETPADRPIIEIAKREVITTQAKVDIRRAAFVMSEYRIGALPVMSEMGQIIGIITRSDLIKRLAKLPPLEIYA